MTKHKVWIQGYHYFGMNNPVKASEYGEVEADTFAEAATKLIMNSGDKVYNLDLLTVNGRRLFDNELQARKIFG